MRRMYGPDHTVLFMWCCACVMLFCETNYSNVRIYVHIRIYLSHVCSHVLMYILHLSEVKGAKDEPSEVQMW